MTEENLLTQWARLLLRSFSEAGVGQVVISPGSRSTPFTAAALVTRGLECSVVIDERDAAFFALGQAKSLGMPVLLICTSGTAGANYLPAVIEAEMSYTPLLLLTADRPTELAHCHAPQTIDQIKLFGDHVSAFFELGEPQASLPALRALRRTAAQAVARSRSPVPGAVHLNARARKPLEPAAAEDAAASALESTVDALLETPLTHYEAPLLGPNSKTLESLRNSISTCKRGLIVAGPGPLRQRECRAQIAELARRSGFPLVVEMASQWRAFPCPQDGPPVLRIGSLDALGRSPTLRERLTPDLILQFGAPPTAAGWSQFIDKNPDCPRIVVHPHGWMDPWNTAREILQVDIADLLAALLPLLETLPAGGESSWASAWSWAEALAWQAAEAVLAESGEALSEGAVARAVVEALPAHGGLALGNSLPIREVDAFSPPQEKPLSVWSQRGASGIDGVLAGASGFAAALGQPSVLLVGDVSFLHGLSGLAILRQTPVPLVVVVVNNDGGRIFEQLPLAPKATSLKISLDPWVTPHGLDLKVAARLYQLPFERVETRESLETSLARALSLGRPAVIEAKVPPGGAILEHRRLWEKVDRNLAKEWGAP